MFFLKLSAYCVIAIYHIILLSKFISLSCDSSIIMLINSVIYIKWE